MSEEQEKSPAVLAAEQAHFRSLMKATEELVTKARLDQIAREHKSIGAILDDRVLYKIEEPKKRNRSETFKTALQLQREKELAEEELVKELQQEKMMVHAAKLLKKQNDYSTEQQIWKEKSGPAVYSQARRFQFPELQKFKERMTHEQQVQFKRRTNAALMALADKYREECRELKADMDLNGVFHPEANAHRVHCIYLMKLYKGIRSDTIEDPVLRQLKNEEEQRARTQKALEEQKQQLLKMMEAADFANMTPAQQEAALAEAEMKKREAEETESDMKIPETGSLDNGSLADGNGNTATNSVVTGNASVGLSVVVPSATPKGAPTPGNSKGNNVQFARNSSSSKMPSAATSEKEAPEKGTDKVLPSVVSGKMAPGSSKMPAGSANMSAGSMKASLSSGKLNSGSTKGGGGRTPKDALARNASFGTASEDEEDGDFGAPTTTTVKRSVGSAKILHKSASTPAVGSATMSSDAGGEGSNPVSSVPFASSASSSKLPPIREPGTGKAGASEPTNKGKPGLEPSRHASHSKSAPALTSTSAGGARRRKPSGVSDDFGEHGSSVVSGSQASPERERNPGRRNDEKLFKRIKNNKLGGAEPRTLLAEEASKLDSAESFSMKKVRDKNTILETEMTDWMLSSVQKAQVGKTASGNAMLTTGGLTQQVKLPANSIITEFNDAIRRTTSSPTKMMPFDQFHKMFEAFSVQHAESKPAAEPAASSVAGASAAAKSAETTGSGTKKPRRRRQTDGNVAAHGHDGNSLTSSQEEDSHVTMRTKGSLLASDALHATHHVEPTNLVKTLAEQDANFEAYLKLAQNQQDTAKDGDTQAKMRNKLNASITAPRKIRKANPLGQTAINLIDSRGRASKDSKKGFGNIFQVRTEEGDGADDATADSSGVSPKKRNLRIDSHISIMGTDNIMGRLTRLDDDDMSHNTVSTYDQHGSAGSHNSSPNSTVRGGAGGTATAAEIAAANAAADEKERFKNSRQSSRSRRRLLSSQEFSGNNSAKGSAKAGQLSGDQDDDTEGVIGDPNPDHTMQDKLVAAWDCLQMPAAQRFGFMHKYSTDEYSMEMGRAVDMWSQAALLVLCIVELNKILGKVKAGTCVLPLTKNTVLRAMRTKIPPILASANSFFIPPSLGYYDAQIAHQTVPLSAESLEKVQSLVHDSFDQYGQPLEGTRKGCGVFDLTDCLIMMTNLVSEAGTMLKRSLKTTHVELADVIPYGAKGCKEWVFGVTGMGSKSANTQLSAGSFDEDDA